MDCSICNDGSHEDLRLLLLDIQRMRIRVTYAAAAEYLGANYSAQSIMSGHVQNALHARVVPAEPEPGNSYSRPVAKTPSLGPLVTDPKELQRQLARLNSQ